MKTMKMWRKDAPQLIEMPRSDVLHPIEEAAMILTECTTRTEVHLEVQVVIDPLKDTFVKLPGVGITPMMEVLIDLRIDDVNPHVMVVNLTRVEATVVIVGAAETVEIVVREKIMIDERVVSERTAEIAGIVVREKIMVEERVATEVTVASVIVMTMMMTTVTEMCAVLGIAMSDLPEKEQTPVAPGRPRRDLCLGHTPDPTAHPLRQLGVAKVTTAKNSLKRKIGLLIEVGTHGHHQLSTDHHRPLCEETIGMMIPKRNTTDALLQFEEMSPHA